MTTQSVSDAFEALKQAISREVLERVSASLNSSLPTTKATIKPSSKRMSAGRKRQIAAMRKYWAKRKAKATA